MTRVDFVYCKKSRELDVFSSDSVMNSSFEGGRRPMKEQFLRNRSLILHYYAIAALVAILFGWFIKREGAIDPTIITILVLYLLFFPVVILYTRKYALHIFLFILALISGFYSFYFYSVGEYSVLNALYFTFKLYVLDISEVYTQDGSSLLRYPLIVELARWSAAMYTISTLFIAMYRMLEMSILLSFFQFIGNHTIVFGYNENSRTLIENLSKKKKRIILVADQITNEDVDYLEELKVVVLNNRNKKENIYTKCGIARAKSVYLVHKEDIDNLDELLGIRYNFIKHSEENRDLTIYLHLYETASRNLFFDLSRTDMERNEYFTIRLVNVYELFVNHLFDEYPIYPSQQTALHLHLCIIGFGPLGQHIAEKVIEQSNKLKQTLPYITALDKAMPKVKQDWQQNYPQLSKCESVELKTFDVTSDPVAAVIQKQDRPITHIYVCLDEEHLDLWAAIELSNQFPNIPIYLEFSEGSIAEKWIQSEVSGNRLIYSIGTFKDVLTEDEMKKGAS